MPYYSTNTLYTLKPANYISYLSRLLAYAAIAFLVMSVMELNESYVMSPRTMAWTYTGAVGALVCFYFFAIKGMSGDPSVYNLEPSHFYAMWGHCKVLVVGAAISIVSVLNFAYGHTAENMALFNTVRDKSAPMPTSIDNRLYTQWHSTMLLVALNCVVIIVYDRVMEIHHYKPIIGDADHKGTLADAFQAPSALTSALVPAIFPKNMIGGGLGV